MKVMKFPRTLSVLLMLAALTATLLAACDNNEPPPAETEATTVAEAPQNDPTQPAATWTPIPAVVIVSVTPAPTDPPPPTPTAAASATPRPATATPEASPTPDESATPEETATETPEATAEATNTRPAATAQPTTTGPTRPPATAAPPAAPTLPPNPVPGENVLPNPSFEEGHYNQNGIPELQLPNGWRLDYQEGATGFGGQAWDVYVRPETRVLSMAFLPAAEHPLYIFDGSQTVKIFKGTGAVSTRLMTDVELQPGTYVLEANFFSDVFESYSDGRKNPPGDPNAGEAMLFAGSGGTGWIGNSYLNRNTLTHTFTVNSAQTMTVGVGFRGRYAIANNGWFVDNLSLRPLQ